MKLRVSFFGLYFVGCQGIFVFLQIVELMLELEDMPDVGLHASSSLVLV